MQINSASVESDTLRSKALCVHFVFNKHDKETCILSVLSCKVHFDYFYENQGLLANINCPSNNLGFDLIFTKRTNYAQFCHLNVSWSF